MRTFVITTAIIRSGNEFLIAKRAATKKFSPNQWEFISGFVDVPESVEEIILRETKEELNIEGRIIDATYPFSFNDGAERWIVIPFLIELDDIHIQINPADHSEARWVTFDKLKGYLDLKPFLENEGIKNFLYPQEK